MLLLLLLFRRPGPSARPPYGTRSRRGGSTSSSPPRTVRSLHVVLVATHPFLDQQAQVRDSPQRKIKGGTEKTFISTLWSFYASLACRIHPSGWPARVVLVQQVCGMVCTPGGHGHSVTVLFILRPFIMHSPVCVFINKRYINVVSATPVRSKNSRQKENVK